MWTSVGRPVRYRSRGSEPQRGRPPRSQSEGAISTGWPFPEGLAGADLEMAYLLKLMLVETGASENGLSKAEASMGYLSRRTIGGGTLVVARLGGAFVDGDTIWPEWFDPVDAGVIFKAFD